MRSSEILARYKQELNDDRFNDIHKKYNLEVDKIIKKHTPKNILSKPLAFLAVLLIVPIVIMYFAEDDFTWPICILVLAIVVVLIVRAINNYIVEKIESNRVWKKRTKGLNEELSDLQWKYYKEFGSMIGFYDFREFRCGDYDENREQAYCSFTGEPISYTKYCNCQKTGHFQFHCPYYSKYLETL